VVAGPPGVGKSIFGLEFIYHGAMAKEPGLYVTIEEKPENLMEQASQFGMSMKKPNIKFLKIPIDTVGVDIIKIIEKEAKKMLSALKKGDRVPPCCGKLMEIMD